MLLTPLTEGYHSRSKQANSNRLRQLRKISPTPTKPADLNRHFWHGNQGDPGLRDRALIAAMLYSFARVSAVLKLKVDDYYHNGARRRLRLHEKGGKEHEMPVHHLLEMILDEYIVAAGLQSGQPLFQSVNSLGTAVTGR